MTRKRLIPWIMIPVGALLAGGPATASPPPRAPKKPMVQVKAAGAEHTRVTPSTVASPRPRRWLDAEQFRRRVQGRVGVLTDRAIAVLKRLIQVAEDDDPRKPDYHFRLAEHYREKKLQFMFRARALDEKIFRARAAADRARLKASQRRYEAAERAWMKKALVQYRHLATHAPFAGYKRMDVVLFNTADLLNKAGRQDLARRFFGKLIRNHPDSKYLADAYLSFAEFYFFNKQVADALKLLVKEDFLPARADKFLYFLAPAFSLIPALLTFAVIPFADTLHLGKYSLTMQVADLNVGLLFIFAIASLGVYGIVWAAGPPITSTPCWAGCAPPHR